MPCFCREEVDGLLCIPVDLDSSYVPTFRPGNNVEIDASFIQLWFVTFIITHYIIVIYIDTVSVSLFKHQYFVKYVLYVSTESCYESRLGFVEGD